ncbi:Pectate lyase [Candidatus Sulfopaludibacter sp. SbA3]|nr:Pectate lyase [Candidatus Sulfopaludibacter sp. SbA3]
MFVSGAAAISVRMALAADSPVADREMAAVLARIQPPKFPDHKFEIVRYGAAADGHTDSSDAIRQAIEDCSAAGGGTVVVPRGTFLTAAIHLKSHTNLRLEEGAILRFYTDPKRYPLVYSRWEGTECMNYSPLIYAFEQTDIAVTGTGMLDGQANTEIWWPWKGNARSGWKAGMPEQKSDRDSLMAMGDKNVPVSQRVFGPGHYLRPPFVQPYRCTNVLIEGITIRNSPFWELNPVLCRNVTVRNVKIDSHGPNNDGCDPESCDGVLIDNCEFSTGDDCIAIKSGRNEDGRRVHTPCQNLVIRNCSMKDGHGGVSIGSEVSGDARNIFVDHCRMDSPNLDRALRLKSNTYRGGVFENIYFTNNTVGQVSEAVVDIDFNYEEGNGGPHNPQVRNVVVENVISAKSKYALYLRGFKNAPITGVRLANCNFKNVAQPNVIENVEGLKLEGVKRNGQPLTQ